MNIKILKLINRNCFALLYIYIYESKAITIFNKKLLYICGKLRNSFYRHIYSFKLNIYTKKLAVQIDKMKKKCDTYFLKHTLNTV